MRKCVAALPVLILAIIYTVGCGGVEHRAENKIAEGLKNRIGPAKSYKVDISSSPLKLLKGKMDALNIVGQDVQLKSGIQIAKLNVSIKDLRFDPDTQQIKSASSCTYSAKINEAELNKYLTKTYNDIPNLQVALNDGYATVTGKPTITGLGVNIKADAGLSVRNGSKVVLELRSISAAGVPAPGFAREYIESKVNPVFDATSLGFDATIDDIAVRHNNVTITGMLDVAKVGAGG
ncbi:MAG: DUF2993 domain-containing protein [Armatimonadota bacterium]|nr:DUF2993 domain-containing protein [bacterium]